MEEYFVSIGKSADTDGGLWKTLKINVCASLIHSKSPAKNAFGKKAVHLLQVLRAQLPIHSLTLTTSSQPQSHTL